MFEVKKYAFDAYYITNKKGFYLHSDGNIFDVAEYFPTAEIAQKILDKFYPKPDRIWENGDVFLSGTGSKIPMIFIRYNAGGKPSQAFALEEEIVRPASDMKAVMDGAEFLFNIREKL